MASVEDDVLMLLIYQHLKVNGFHKAAKGLEKHVTQVDQPEDTQSLQDIYKDWTKLYSLAKNTKQKMNDADFNGSVESEPASKEGETAKPEWSKRDSDAESKSAADVMESAQTDAEVICEQLPDAVDKIPDENSAIARSEDVSEQSIEETKTENEAESPAVACMEEEAKAESIQGDSTDDTVEQTQSCAEAMEEPPQELEKTDPCTEVTELGDVEQTVPSLQSSEDAEADSNIPSMETNGQHCDDGEAPPPAEAESSRETQDVEECISTSTAGDLIAELKPEVQILTSGRPSDAVELPISCTEAAADGSILINLQLSEEDTAEEKGSKLLPDEAADSSKSPKTPRRKKRRKSKKEDEVPTEDVIVSETSGNDISSSEMVAETPPSRESAKKKKVEKIMDEEEASSKTVSKKKRKREKKKKLELNGEEVETPVTSPEKKDKKKKRKLEDVEEEEQPVTVVDELGNSENPGINEGKLKKKKRRRKQRIEMEEMQSEMQTAGGDKASEEAEDVKDSVLTSSAIKKRRVRKKTSQKKRLKLKKEEKIIPAQSHSGKTKMIQEQTEAPSRPKPAKRPQSDSAQEEQTPKKKKKQKLHANGDEMENSSKENLPPKTKKETEGAVVKDLSTEFAEINGDSLSNGGKKKKKKKKAVEIDDPAEDVTPVPFNKGSQEAKKSKITDGAKKPDADVSVSKKKSPKKKKMDRSQ